MLSIRCRVPGAGAGGLLFAIVRRGGENCEVVEHSDIAVLNVAGPSSQRLGRGMPFAFDVVGQMIGMAIDGSPIGGTTWTLWPPGMR